MSAGDMKDATYLTGQLLIAMPSMLDPNFHRTVTFICEHSEHGALGLIINRPLDIDLGEVFQQLSMTSKDPIIASTPILRGGPVQMERGFVVHDSQEMWETTTQVANTIRVTTSQDILTSMAQGSGPPRAMVALGYAGWGAGQLGAGNHRKRMAQRAGQLADSVRHPVRGSVDICCRIAGNRHRHAEHGSRPRLTTRENDTITRDSHRPRAALAFDFGDRRIGVAYANGATGTATALKTLENRGDEALARELETLFDEWEPDTIVIGVPYNMDGSESQMTPKAIEFAQRLGEMHGLPVDQVDERLTSSEAGRMLREQRQSGQRSRKVRKGDIDSLSAQLIAESWLREE